MRLSSPRVGVPATAHASRRAEQEARLSWWMVATFAVWTVAFVLLSGPVAEALGFPTSGGEVMYIQRWVPWIGVTVLWVLPLLVGIGLAADARRRGHGGQARAALIVESILLLGATGPALLDRLLHLG